MIRMEFIADIRRRHLVDGESISSIARDLQRSRPTVRKALTTLTEPVYHRQYQPVPKLGEFQPQLGNVHQLFPDFRVASMLRSQ